MRMIWSIDPVTLDLRYTWKISRNATDQKTNLIVSVNDGRHSAKGEAAPNIRYDETPEKLKEEFIRFQSIATETDFSHELLLQTIHNLNLSHSLSFAIESAFIHH